MYWVSIYNDGEWDTVLETEDINEVLDAKEHYESLGFEILVDHDD